MDMLTHEGAACATWQGDVDGEAGGDERFIGGRWVESGHGRRFELSEAMTDAKLWAGAYSEGWHVREQYRDSRLLGSWCYVAPGDIRFRVLREAFKHAGREFDAMGARASWAGGGRGRGRGHGGGRGRGRAHAPRAPVHAADWQPGCGYPRVSLIMSRNGAPAPAEAEADAPSEAPAAKSGKGSSKKRKAE